MRSLTVSRSMQYPVRTERSAEGAESKCGNGLNSLGRSCFDFAALRSTRTVIRVLHHAVSFVLGSALLLQGCVTINIYFPAAAAEKAADKIIDEVWQLKKPGEPAAPSSK